MAGVGLVGMIECVLLVFDVYYEAGGFCLQHSRWDWKGVRVQVDPFEDNLLLGDLDCLPIADMCQTRTLHIAKQVVRITRVMLVENRIAVRTADVTESQLGSGCRAWFQEANGFDRPWNTSCCNEAKVLQLHLDVSVLEGHRGHFGPSFLAGLPYLCWLQRKLA